jgi:hypothetical protein
MVAPSTYPLTIKVNDVDVTANVDFSTIDFQDHATQVSWMRFTIENPSGVTPAKSHSVSVVSGSTVVFFGLIMELKTKKHDNGHVLDYEVECADQKIRLQKSLVGFNIFSGTDASILSSLLSNAYPDLSSLFDFSTGVTGFMDDLTLPANEDNLLDLLADLSELSNNADYRFEYTGSGGNVTVDFEATGHSDFSTAESGGWTLTTTGSGNGGGNAFKGTKASVSTGDFFEIQVNFPSPVIVQTLDFDFYADSNDISAVLIEVNWDGFSSALWFDPNISDSTWTPVEWNDQTGFGDGFDREVFPAYINSEITIQVQVNVGGSGAWDIRLDNIVFGTANDTAKIVTFDVGGDSSSTSDTNMDSTATEAGGNTGNTFRGTTTSTSAQDITVTHDLGTDTAIYGIGAHLKYVGGGAEENVDLEYEIRNNVLSVVSSGTLPGSLRTSDWYYIGKPFTTPITGQHIDIILGHQTSVPAGSKTYRIDNMIVVLNAEGDAATPSGQELQWSDTPDATDFNIDVQSGDEFAFDIDLSEGDIDDFNSVTVTGGYEEVAIDWTYESDGDMDHFDLELPIDSLAVFKNTNTDASPTWTAQTLGTWGTDDRTVDGGSKDVLYDPDNHWLYFNSNPSNLSKSIRVTGTIRKPIRVRVEDISGSDPTFATSIHNDNITSVDEAVTLGQAALDKRKGITRLEFSTYEPGLKPGQTITVTDSARGLSESIKIQQINTKWLGASGHAQFKIMAGNEETTGLDVLVANNDRRSRPKPLPAATTIQTATLLQDVDGESLQDVDGELLYEVS